MTKIFAVKTEIWWRKHSDTHDKRNRIHLESAPKHRIFSLPKTI